ncbi:hypothetical protein GRF29_216g162704 [Pseudopithomyces chartarum]|uniref:Survival protein SurE-like phosphatase/nucleotidase domain-containing protein n=1 Tax=Pseudopithomyces chartarum TaxID=1892770 RepID=A0AAN6LLJ4_9PLEO|nr:hypothetical protein GRF29_216g162704 [Pseudopithomyces chartarum]
MRLHALLPLLSLLPSTSALNILLNNDDGFASANLRLLYTHLLAANHSVLIVAPATQQSGQGGRTDFTVYKNLTAPSQYDIIPAGSPSLGTDPHDSNIWYYNGTPAACTFVALDYVLPRYYPGWVPDLALAGPNYGTNLGPFVMGLSGTVGATFAAVSRSVPAIALSASNKAVPYFNVTSEGHPAALAAKAAYHIVERFIDSTAPGGVVLPLGYGVNVNIPELDANGTLPPIIKSRLTGAAETDVAVYDEESVCSAMGDALAAVRRGDWARCDGWEWEEGGGDRICGRGETRADFNREFPDSSSLALPRTPGTIFLTMRPTTFFLPLLPLVSAHGRITNITTPSGTIYPGFDPSAPRPSLPAWSTTAVGNVFVPPLNSTPQLYPATSTPPQPRSPSPWPHPRA